jgi:ribosomal protein S18 acetylase RimI-like enzyme
MEFVQASPDQDEVIASHYMAIWESYGTAPEKLREDSFHIVYSFLRQGRDRHGLASFIAFDEKVAAGSVSCRLNVRAYPTVLKRDHSHEGYIWSVYTDPAYRGQGVARRLVQMAIDHLERCGCTSVVLHSSDAGKKLYSGLGFELATEMRLKFSAIVNLQAS